MLGHAEVVTAARDLMERTDPATAGLWPRATALLARQALEAALDDFWKVRAPGMEQCSMKAQLLCLPQYLQDPKPPSPQAPKPALSRSESPTRGPGSAGHAISIHMSCPRPVTP